MIWITFLTLLHYMHYYYYCTIITILPHSVCMYVHLAVTMRRSPLMFYILSSIVISFCTLHPVFVLLHLYAQCSCILILNVVHVSILFSI